MSTAVARILGELRNRGGLRGADIANIVDVSRPTVSRWTKGRASPSLHTQTVIAELRYVVERLSDFYSPQGNPPVASHVASVTPRRAGGRLDSRWPL